MTIKLATDLIKQCMEQMNAHYQGVIFDEWAIVSLADSRGRLLAYSGPRKANFQSNFATDAGGLRAGLSGNHAPGHYEFARDHAGTAFEAFLVLGGGSYLICNNTQQTMEQICKNPRWLKAQVPFAELSETIADNPVEADHPSPATRKAA